MTTLLPVFVAGYALGCVTILALHRAWKWRKYRNCKTVFEVRIEK